MVVIRATEILELAVRAAGLEAVPPDSGVLVEGEGITKILFGIDMGAAEILIAKQLGFHGVITHHPKGGEAMVNLSQVMQNQIQRMVNAGIPINKAQKVLKERQEEVERRVYAENYDREVSAARLLGMPFIALHTPCDILAEQTVQGHLDRRLADRPQATLKDLLDILGELPEYKNALVKPKIRVGAPESYAGRVYVTMAGGTSGGKEVFKAYFEAGVGTLVVMHCPDDVLEAVRQQNIGNIIIAGHMASDSVGINKMITVLSQYGLECTRCAGVVDPGGDNLQQQ